MKKIYFIIAGICFIQVLHAQEKIEDILYSNNTYSQIVGMAEKYFAEEQQKAALFGLDKNELDDDLVKFRRWQSFWKHALTPDGHLGDISAYWRNADPAQLAKMTSPYSNVAWTNLSSDKYIGSQIGLGRVTSVGFHPTDSNTFYVGAAIGGIWKTSDGGTTYTALGDELPYMAVSSIIVNKTTPHILYIAVSDHVWYGPPSIGVYKSINSGQSWQPTALSFKMSDNIRIYWMEADPNNADKIFVATSDGLYLTTNSFISVTKINAISCFDVKINPGNSSIVYLCGSNGEFLRSTDGGNNFSLIRDFGNGNVYAAVTSLNASKVYVRNANQLYKSTDNGFTFPATGLTMLESNSVLAFAPSSQTTLLTGNFETQRSDNDGTFFYATSQWLGNNGLQLIHVDQRNIFTNPLQPDAVYYCNDGGLYRYSVSNNKFTFVSNGMLITQFYDISLAQNAQNIIGGGSQDNGSMYRASNGSWYAYAPTGDGMKGDIDPTDSSTRYWAYQNGAINRWFNGVNTVISPPGKNGTGAWETPFQLDPTNPARIIAGYNQVYLSPDKGNTWSSISASISFGGNLEELTVAKANPNRIYASRGSQLYVKDVSSNSWTARALPGAANDIEVDPYNMDVLYITVGGFVPGSKVFKSTNAGVTWTNISGTLPNVSTQALATYDSISGALFVGTDAGVYYIDNTLSDWQEYGKLPHTRVTDIEIHYAAKLVRVGTHGRSVFEAPIIIKPCRYGDPDADNDGVCDANDVCPNFDNSLNGTPCDDGDPNTTGETYIGCACKVGKVTTNYCAATGAANTGGDWINRVNLNTLDYASGKTAYSDFRTQSTTLGPGGTYTLTVELNSFNSLDKVYAWIDYNRNGTFEAQDLISMSAPNAEGLSQGTVTVPANVGNLATTMRVRTINASINNPEPCGSYVGEVEDYTIDFAECQAAGAFGTGDDWISQVKLNTISNTSVQTPYSDFTNLSTDLARGESYPISVTLNYSFAIDSVFVWIDYNQNHQFEANEQVIMTRPAEGPNSASSGNVAVPAGALPGETVMRVRVQYGSAASACGSYYGEVEDYTVNITYCAAAGLVGTSSDYINRVQLNTLNNPSGKTGYSNFKNLATNLVRGSLYPVQVQLAYAFDLDSVYTWIDYNRNGVFENSEQTIMTLASRNTFNAIANGIVNVPLSAIQGTTVMRVRVIYANPNTAQPCGDYFGEVEDYTVNLTYCGARAADGTGDDWIENVSLNYISNTTGKTTYSDYKEIVTPLYTDNSYELSVKINFAFDLDTVYAWIDYDRNNSFTINERIMMSNLVANSKSTSSGIIYIPANTPTGETRLRVRVIYANPNPPDPCNAYWGEVEDYVVKITNNQGQGECPPAVTLGKELISLASGVYKAANTINTTSKIANNKTVVMPAGKSIIMNPGFIAEKGAVLTAEIKPCSQ